MPKDTDKPTQKEIEQLRRYQFAAAMESCEYFIEKFVKIEDRDAAELAVPFKLWPAQKEGLHTIQTNKLVVALKARQLGFSWMALSYAAWMVLHPGKSVLALSKTEEDAKELVRRIVFEFRNLPEWMITQANAPLKGRITYDSMATQATVSHPNGEPSFFRSFPAGQNSGAGFTGNLLILDEWALQQYASDIWTAAFPTINRPNGGQVIGISTNRHGSFFEEIVLGAMAGTNGFKLIFWPWNTDPRRDAAWYNSTVKALGIEKVKQEYPATIDEALEAQGGKFFKEVTDATHNKKLPIPAYCRRYVSIDYGLDMLAGLYIWDDGQHCHVYDEVYKPDLIISAAAQELTKKAGKTNIDARYAPPDLWNRRQETGHSAEYTFRQNGWPLIMTNNDREQGCWDMKEWLRVVEVKSEITGETTEMPRLTIDKDKCPNLWRCLVKIQADEKNPNVYADKPHELSHSVDALRYFCDAVKYPVKQMSQKRNGWYPFLDEQPESNGIMDW